MFNQPMFNPQIMQLLNIARSNGNPMMLMQNMFGDNPVFQKVMAMGQGKNPTQLQEVVRNIAHEQGMSVECYGEHFSDWLAQHAVHQMKNVDGSEGEHWSIGQIDDIIRQHSIKCDNFNRWDLYYVMNMFFSDYYNVFGTDTSTYVKLSKAWFNDVDVSEGKAYRYYMNVVKSK